MKVNEPDFTYGHHTYADYLLWELDERLELIKGKIFKMSPGPMRIHQKIFRKVFTPLSFFLTGEKCEVYSAPFDVRLPVRSLRDEDIITVVQPDICVICDQSKLDRRGCIGAPDIVVEILSPGNSKKELQNKYEVYEESGVKEYWIIHPDGESMIIYTLTDGKYIPSKLFTRGDIITTPILPGFMLNLDDVFEEEVY